MEMNIKVKEWYKPDEQQIALDGKTWAIARLFELSRHLPVMDVPLDHLYISYSYQELSMRDMVMHMRAVNNADLAMPIILDEDGRLFDGRHRVMKAILNGEATIKAVRFIENPTPCQIHN